MSSGVLDDRRLCEAAEPLGKEFDELVCRRRQRSTLLLSHQDQALVLEQLQRLVVDWMSMEKVAHLGVEVVARRRARWGAPLTPRGLVAHVPVDGAVHPRIEEKEVGTGDERALDDELVGDDGDDVTVETLGLRPAFEVFDQRQRRRV